VYTFLLDLIDSNHPSIVSQDPQHLTKLVGVIAAVLIRPSLLESAPDVTQRLVAKFGQIVGGCDAGTKAGLMNSLGAETQSFLASKGYI
jgi:hypothetical protein